MLVTRWRAETAGDVSEFTFATFRVPARSLPICSITGLTIRQGPHQGAQMSTRTGRGLLSTASANRSSPTSTSHGRSWWQFAHRGRPVAASGTRLRRPQDGQATTAVTALRGVEGTA